MSKFHRFTHTVALVLGLVTPVISHAADTPANTATALFAGGCFWCVQSDFDKAAGVIKTEPGYAGGTIKNPTYENYHNEGPGIVSHIEVLQVTYDTSKTSYDDLLKYYFRHIDPLDNTGQFCDKGPAYRPVIFVANDTEKKLAEAEKANTAALLKADVKVEIMPAATFWPAEDYHNNYYKKNPKRYEYYRWRCGRDARVKEVWAQVK